MDMHASNFHKSTCYTDNRHNLRLSLARHRSFAPSKAGYRQCCPRRTSARSDHRAFDQQESPTPVPSDPTDHTHIGITPGQPDSPQHPSANRSGSFVLALAVFVGVAWGLVTFWGQLSAHIAQKQPKKPAQTPSAGAPATFQSRREKRRSKPDPNATNSTSGSWTNAKQPLSRSNIICRHFAATGSCKYGDNCRFRHVYMPESVGAFSPGSSSSSRQTTADSYDSASESDSDDSAAHSSGPSQLPAREFGKYMDNIGKPYGPTPVQTLKETYHVPPKQAQDVGRLMGWGGRRIRRISQDTGCCIVVGRNLPAGESVPIDVFAEHQSELSEAVKLIAECFEAEEDGLDTDEDDARDSANSDSDVEDSSALSSDSGQSKLAADTKSRPHYGLKETYVVSSDMAQKHMGRLMGKGGRKITGISYVTGCTISVPKFKDRPPEEPVEILVYGENQSSLSEAVRLIASCFEED